jgi:hypothetical protein
VRKAYTPIVDLGFDELAVAISERINQILAMDVDRLQLNDTETAKRIKQKSYLRDAIRNCCLGDPGKRIFVKDYIRDLLQESNEIDTS